MNQRLSALLTRVPGTVERELWLGSVDVCRRIWTILAVIAPDMGEMPPVPRTPDGQLSAINDYLSTLEVARLVTEGRTIALEEFVL